MSERKKFACPACGEDSWLDTETLVVEHGEPHCEQWKAAQQAARGAVVLTEQDATGATPGPTEVHFDCPECKARVRMRPLEQPISVEHALPSCEAWAKIEGKKDDLERYLIKAGAHIHVPVRA